jgi:N-acetylmuramoyl-L-alanine amidase
VIGTVTDVPITRDGATWYRIQTDEGEGWVVETFLAPATSDNAPAAGFEPGTAVTVTTDVVNLRNSASMQGSVVAELRTGAAGTVVGGTMQTEGYTWVEATFDGATGWIATAFIGRATASPAYTGNLQVGMTAEIMSDHVNVRPAASLSSTVNGQLWPGHIVTIVDGPVMSEGYTWFSVEGNWSGWVVDVWLAPIEAAGIGIGATVRVFDGELNLRSGPSESDSVIAVLPDGAMVEVLEGPQTADGHDWYRLSSSRYGTGWAVADWLERA